MKLLAVLILSLLSIGCATTPKAPEQKAVWKVDKNDAEKMAVAQKDHEECQKYALDAVVARRDRRITREWAYNECMKLRGYQAIWVNAEGAE